MSNITGLLADDNGSTSRTVINTNFETLNTDKLEGSNFVDEEVVNGSGTTWTLEDTPVAGSVKLTGSGQRLKRDDDYTISGVNITTINSYTTGSILADYRKA